MTLKDYGTKANKTCQSSACTHTLSSPLPTPPREKAPTRQSQSLQGSQRRPSGLWPHSRNSQEIRIKINGKPYQSLGDNRATPLPEAVWSLQTGSWETLPRESALPDLCLNHPAERDRTFAPSLVTSLKSKGWFNIARNIYCLSQLQTNYKLTKYLKRLFQYLVTLEADTQSLIGMFFSALPSELN